LTIHSSLMTITMAWWGFTYSFLGLVRDLAAPDWNCAWMHCWSWPFA